jgi:dolichol-phosphate mannosyltransferase
VTGWTALIIAILFLGGAQLISLGIIGEYVGRLYGEAKGRPLYLVRQTLGMDAPAQGYPRLETARGDRSRPDRRSWRERRSAREQRGNSRRSAQPA